MSRHDRQRHFDRRPRLVAARPALDPVGRVVLLQRRGAEGIAAADGGVPARGARRDHAAAAAVALPHPLPGGPVRLAAVHRHRASQQRAAVLADRGRADLYSGRAGLDPERHDAAVHGGRDGGGRRGKAARAADRGRRRGPDRRDHSPRRRLWVGERAGARHPALPCGRLLLRIVGAAGATAAVELAAARHRDVPDAGLGRDDDRCRRLRRTSLAIADAGRRRHGSP